MLFFACSSSNDNISNPDPAPVNTTTSSVTITSQNSYTGDINESFPLSANVRNSDGNILNNQSLVWSSSDVSVATITNSGSLKIVGAGQITITVSLGTVQDSKTITIELSPPDLLVFSISDLSTALDNQGGNSIAFLDESTMSGTFLALKIGEANTTSSSNWDQVFYFFEGSGTMIIEGQIVEITAESTLFIKANSNWNINAVTSDMKVITVEIKTAFSQSPSPFRSFSYTQIEGTRNPSQNVWNPFLNEASVIFELYMLPQVLGGDNRLVHDFDELNIITRGSSQFQTDEGNINVDVGSIVYVREGNGHAFKSLTEDIDILILWNK